MASSVLNDSFRTGGRDLSSVDSFWPIASQFICHCLPHLEMEIAKLCLFFAIWDSKQCLINSRWKGGEKRDVEFVGNHQFKSCRRGLVNLTNPSFCCENGVSLTSAAISSGGHGLYLNVLFVVQYIVTNLGSELGGANYRRISLENCVNLNKIQAIVVTWLLKIYFTYLLEVLCSRMKVGQSSEILGSIQKRVLLRKPMERCQPYSIHK